jgi:hypothetical protein
MGLISPTLPTSGQDRGTEEVDVLNALTALVNLVNGSLDVNNLSGSAGITAAQLASAIKQQVGLNDGTTVRRGKTIIATEESRTNVAYGLMTTPDRVQNIVLPTDGLIVVAYQAMFKSSVGGAGKAAIFLGANQLKVHMPGTAGASVVQETTSSTTADLYKPVGTTPFGLHAYQGSQAFSGWGTTGEALAVHGDPAGAGTIPYGGICHVWADAGTYDISVQFKATSGSASVKNRKLWVWALGF